VNGRTVEVRKRALLVGGLRPSTFTVLVDGTPVAEARAT
jgi:hypothetical protein